MSRRAAVLTLATAVALGAVVAPIVAQDDTLTLQQVEQMYPRMSPVHIRKCDKDGDGSYTKTDMLCVSSIYRVMYLDKR